MKKYELTDKKIEVKGIRIPITATIKIRVCNECGAEVWDEQLEKINETIVNALNVTNYKEE